MWTKKHDEFALACNFSESMSYLARFILRRAKLGEPTEIELNLKQFNKWVGKQRFKGEYHRKTLSTAIANLDAQSQGMFVILKKYNPWIYKLLVRPLSVVAKIQSSKCASSLKPPTGNPMFDADHKKRLLEQQQQDISKLDSILKKIGLHYTQDALLRIWRLAGKSFDEIQSAIELMLAQNSSEALYSRSPEPEASIRNPHGWLVSCLKNAWQKGFNLYYDCQLPYFRYAKDIANFVADSLFSSKVCQT